MFSDPRILRGACRGSVTPWGYMGMEFLDGVNYYCILLAFILVLATDNDRILKMFWFFHFCSTSRSDMFYPRLDTGASCYITINIYFPLVILRFLSLFLEHFKRFSKENTPWLCVCLTWRLVFNSENCRTLLVSLYYGLIVERTKLETV